MITRRAWLGGVLAALPAACSSPNPNLYTMAVLPGTARSGAPRNIEIRSIALAHYLERNQIVQSSDNYRLSVLSNDWWGEPLDAMLNRVLVQELSQRLPGSAIFAENGAISVTADATVEINLQRLDENAVGAVVLLAQVAVSGQRAAARDVRFEVRPDAPGIGSMVAAMSMATGQLADVLAGLLTQGK